MYQGWDAYSPPNDTLAAKAVAAGMSFFGGYYGTGGKVLQPYHMPVFTKHSLPLISYFERDAKRALQGAAAGVEDAMLAYNQAKAVGQPAGTPIHFALDFDANTADLASTRAIELYFRALDRALVVYRVGVYGDGAICGDLLDRGLVTSCVLAGASGWTGSHDFIRFNVHQLAELAVGAPGNRLGIDYDPLLCDDLVAAGSWLPGGAVVVAPVQPTIPKLNHPEVLDFITAVDKIQTFLIAQKEYNGPVDGDFGTESRAAFERYKARS